MIINRLIIPEYNDINFVVNHTENGEIYNLPSDYRYYIIVAKGENPYETVCFYESDNRHFNFSQSFPVGEYIFEVGIINGNGERTVILPSLDERQKPLNQLIVLRRLSYAGV